MMKNTLESPIRTPHIFLIDDDENDIFFAKRAILQIRPDCIIDVATDGRQAIAHLSGGPVPHLIFLDLNLPGMSGLEILQHIRSRPHTSSVPVVVVSSSTLERDIRQSLDAGADNYVQKSHDFSLFSQHLQKAIESALGSAS